jgi:hypothetical protein
MSVAALEAETFRELLETGEGDFHDLPRAFLRRADQIIEAPWNMAAAPDLAYPDTRGERPLLRKTKEFHHEYEWRHDLRDD